MTPIARLRVLCMALPEAEERETWDIPTFRVRDKIFAMAHPDKGRPSVWMKAPRGTQAILTEATLSFLGVGVPPTSPSLGTLIRVGNDFLFSGEWWITIFPGLMLVLIALSVNLLGDWLRDAVNPRLR